MKKTLLAIFILLCAGCGGNDAATTDADQPGAPTPGAVTTLAKKTPMTSTPLMVTVGENDQKQNKICPLWITSVTNSCWPTTPQPDARDVVCSKANRDIYWQIAVDDIPDASNQLFISNVAATSDLVQDEDDLKCNRHGKTGYKCRVNENLQPNQIVTYMLEIQNGAGNNGVKCDTDPTIIIH